MHGERVKLNETQYIALFSPDIRAGRYRRPPVNERS